MDSWLRGGKAATTKTSSTATASRKGSSWKTETVDLTLDDDDDGCRRPGPPTRRLPWAKAERGTAEAPPPSSLGGALSEEQRGVVDVVARGESVFITGNAGSGKSYALRAAVEVLRERHGPSGVYVTASTGAAATQVGGTTIHAFAGVGLGVEDKRELGNKVEGNRKSAKRWRDCCALVIDEISMIDAALFDKLEFVARHVRRSDEAFGGIQLVVCGDFLQLPPVSKATADPVFAFESEAWARCFGSSSNRSRGREMALTRVFRQRDPRFVAVLNEMRTATLSPASIDLLRGLGRADLTSFAPLEPTRLSSRNADVDRTNAARLAALKTTTGGAAVQHVDAVDSGADPYLTTLQKNSSFPQRLSLKVGAQVMLLTNTDVEKGLVNGARGVVADFSFDDKGAIDAIHVTFAGGLRHRVEKDTAKVEEGSAVKANRLQFPLRLAWAISIHKAQGQTLDLLEVDLKGCFEFGQAYTAVSRATDLSKLRVLNFDPAAVRAHPRVVGFHARLNNTRATSGPGAYPPPSNSTTFKENDNTPANPIYPDQDADGWISTTKKTPPRSLSPAAKRPKHPVNKEDPDHPSSHHHKNSKNNNHQGALRGRVFAFVGALGDEAEAHARRTIVAHGGDVDVDLGPRTTTLLCADSLADGSVVETSRSYAEARRRGLEVIGTLKLAALLN